MSEEAWRRTSRAAPYHYTGGRSGERPPQVKEPWEWALYPSPKENDEDAYRKLKREDELNGSADELRVTDQTYDDGPEDWSNT